MDRILRKIYKLGKTQIVKNYFNEILDCKNFEFLLEIYFKLICNLICDDNNIPHNWVINCLDLIK